MLHQNYIRRSRAKINLVNLIALIASTGFAFMCGAIVQNGLIILLASPAMFVCVKAWLLGTKNDADIRWFSMFLVTLSITLTLLFK